MKHNLIIFSLLLAGLSSCKKQVENGRPEFMGYWSGGSYAEYGYIYLNVNENNHASFYMLDYENDHDYHSGGTARADNKKLTIGGVKYFTIVEYPHRIDTNVERKYVNNHLNSSYKIATWKMVIDGLHGSTNCNVGAWTYYKAD